MEQKRTTDSGAGQDLGDVHEGTLGAGSRTTAKYGRKDWPDLQQGAMKISPQVEQTRDRARGGSSSVTDCQASTILHVHVMSLLPKVRGRTFCGGEGDVMN